MQLYEFQCALRYLQRLSGSKLRQAETLFFTKWDKIDPETEEKSLSLARFINLCVEHNWFKNFDLSKFLKDNCEDKVSDFASLKKRWKNLKNDVQKRLFKAKQLEGFYSRALSKIDKTLARDEILADPNLQMITLLTYKIVELESREIYLNFQVVTCIPKDFLTIQETYKEMSLEDGDELAKNTSQLQAE